jgi:2-iminoacetate synthase
VSENDVHRALSAHSPGLREFVTLLSPAGKGALELMAQQAKALTARHFGKTISLYAPLYLSNFCSGGCLYCGFASDREQERHRLEEDEALAEIAALKLMGFSDILLLTGERTTEVDFDYLHASVVLAAKHFHSVTVEAFTMTMAEYRALSNAGCTGITLYQETYDPKLYAALHRWGAKRNYTSRLEAPARALSAGMRTVGIGALLGLGDPIYDVICLFQHIRYLQKRFWQGGVLVSFPRICGQPGGYESAHHISDDCLAQIIFAFRICLPDVPLVLSTRESPAFRDGMAGVGISRMSAASRTTVGGYDSDQHATQGQFRVSDTRDVESFCGALKNKGLEPVFKNWDSVFSETQ